MVTFTPSAAAAARQAIESAVPPVKGIRLAVEGQSCSGPNCSLALEDEVRADDTVFDCHGVSVFVASASLEQITGTTVDFNSEAGGSFVLGNPSWRKKSGGCGCGGH